MKTVVLWAYLYLLAIYGLVGYFTVTTLRQWVALSFNYELAAVVAFVGLTGISQAIITFQFNRSHRG